MSEINRFFNTISIFINRFSDSYFSIWKFVFTIFLGCSAFLCQPAFGTKAEIWSYFINSQKSCKNMQKTLKRYILGSIWSVQHQNAGQNIEQTGRLITCYMNWIPQYFATRIFLLKDFGFSDWDWSC